MTFTYEAKLVADECKVRLLIKHPDKNKDEILTFQTLEDMEICAELRTYIPLNIWKMLVDMLVESFAFYQPKYIF